MSARQEDTSGEITYLKRCLNDLVSVLALPALWSGSSPSQIVHTLLDTMLGMLCLDLVYARLQDPAGGAPIEVLKIAPSATCLVPDEILKTVNQWFGDDPQKWPSRLRASMGDEDISIVSQRCGLQISATCRVPDEILKTVNQWFGDDPQKWPSRLRASMGDEDISIVSQRCGL